MVSAIGARLTFIPNSSSMPFLFIVSFSMALYPPFLYNSCGDKKGLSIISLLEFNLDTVPPSSSIAINSGIDDVF